MMAMKLLDLYKSILKTAQMTSTSDGFIKMELMGESKPALIKGKQLVLPTQEHLMNPDWKNRVVFHPLSENILRAESDVLGFFRQAINIRLNFTLGILAYQLLTIATSSAEHPNLSPDQSEFLSKVKNADEKTLDVLRKLTMAMPSNQTQKSYISIYLKRGGVVDGKKYARVGVVSFPLYNELKKEINEVYGIKMRVKDRESLIALFEYMIPGIEISESHNRGSNSEFAPSLDALMHALLSIAAPINDVVELFRNQFDELDMLLFDDAWVETFENIAVMQNEIRSVPMQAGNEGVPPKSELASPQVVEPPPPPVFAPPPPVQPPPQQWNAPAQQPPYPGAYPGYNPAPPPPPPPVNTGRGVSLDAIMQSNPALAYQANQAAAQFGAPPPMMGGYPGGTPYVQERQPRWAQPQQPAYPNQGIWPQQQNYPSGRF